MDWDRINKAIEIAEKLQYFFIATADNQGLPHVATAGKLELKSPGTLEMSFWFCPTTIDNLQQNKKVSLVIWDANENSGYQLLGTASDVHVSKVLDRYGSEVEEKERYPQFFMHLTVHVDMVMEFIHALHNDIAF
ncbi:MAG: pyridoxamine 5'-phosphate oxidase family protein [Candidatus Omnitrophica bacterium]|nr:pyridoxamine 5'-phosphate oxidase family protein [Candidatus Omnitrophota bacterium]